MSSALTGPERISYCDHGVNMGGDAVCAECSKIRPPAIRCHYCGKFRRYEDIAWEMPYVGDLCVRLEPPENVPVCEACS